MRTLISRIRGHRAGTGYGWSCPPCRINAGDPDNPFTSEHDALDSLNRHANDSHDGAIQDGSYVGEIAWN